MENFFGGGVNGAISPRTAPGAIRWAGYGTTHDTSPGSLTWFPTTLTSSDPLKIAVAGFAILYIVGAVGYSGGKRKGFGNREQLRAAMRKTKFAKDVSMR